MDPVRTQGSIRFSLGKGNTREEIDFVVKALPPIIEKLRKMSPLYKEK
jgi:cysteine desulfurase